MARKLNLDTSERLDITCKRGDSFSMSVTLKDNSGQPLALVTDGYVFQMQVRTATTGVPSSPNKTPIVLKTAEKAVPETSRSDSEEQTFNTTIDDSGVVNIFATAQAMRNVSPGRYIYELQYSVPDGERTIVKTVLKGSFVVKDDVSE